MPEALCPHRRPRAQANRRWRTAGRSRSACGRPMKPSVVVADAAYGTTAHLRAALADRGLAYVLAVRADVTAHPSQ
ncbi:transposase [Streptomyces sp. ME19-01-6]|nr:transposase [Streptomyces sp. ME19-01-6]